MKVVLFGGTGMVGQGVLRECLLASDVSEVVSVGRRPLGTQHVKLRELIVPDLASLDANDPLLTNIDACFFCLGVSSVGMSEAAYTRITYDLTMHIAQTLVAKNSSMIFVYVTGAGTDSTERGRSMWARVKGRTENALLRTGFREAYMFRPSLIIPLHGIKPVSRWYRAAYAVMRPFLPIIRRRTPKSVTTTEQVGRAMLAVARHGYHKPILDPRDINAL